jgi:hypothetical protein
VVVAVVAELEVVVVQVVIAHQLLQNLLVEGPLQSLF